MYTVLLALLSTIVLCAPLPSTTTTTGTTNCTPYIVKSGDTCYSIANAAGMRSWELTAMNPTVSRDCSDLQIGQSICLDRSSNFPLFFHFPHSDPSSSPQLLQLPRQHPRPTPPPHRPPSNPNLPAKNISSNQAITATPSLKPTASPFPPSSRRILRWEAVSIFNPDRKFVSRVD